MFLAVRRYSALAICLLIGAFTLAAHAQEGPPPDQHARPAPQGEDKPPPGYSHKLPPNSVTSHTLALAGRTLSFKATAGTIKLMDGKGSEIADVAFVAYLLDGAEAKSRPVTFVFNGGPGAASVWLDLGALGPWRLPMRDGTVTPSMTPALVDNEDTWLDFTDLVFIDPPGTGYSQIVAQGDDARKRLWSVDGDIDALSRRRAPLAGEQPAAGIAEIHCWRELWRLSRAAPRQVAGDGAGGRGQRPRLDLAGPRFLQVRRRE